VSLIVKLHQCWMVDCHA